MTPPTLADAPRRLPNFLGIGAPKAATTWLHRCLTEHPEVFAAPAKDVNFLAYLDSIDDRLGEYAEFFKEARPHHRAVVEFSTGYLTFQQTPERVKRHLPDCRFIVSLRNPREQVVSHYWHLRRQQFHGRDSNWFRRPPSLETALRTQREALVEPALYSEHLARWFSLFDRSRFHVILYDDVSSDPKGVLQRLYGFLGVDPSFLPESLFLRSEATRRGVSPRSHALEVAYRFIYRGLNRYAYTPLKQAVGWSNADAIKRRLRARERLETFFFKPGYDELTPSEVQSLDATFSDEIGRLEALIGCDLSRWRTARLHGSGQESDSALSG